MNQRISSGNVLIIGEGGEVIIPKDYKLTTQSSNDDSGFGLIYVMPGGRIIGEGSIELTSSEENYHYNGGDIMVDELLLSGGILYNIGTIGNSIVTTTSMTLSNGADGQSGSLINRGFTYLTRISGDNLSIRNGVHSH